MNRTWFINKLVECNNFNSYLEIGVRNKDDNYNHIKIENKECIDPNPASNPTYTLTSDEFFLQIPKDKKYDLIFIDGMHVEEYSDRDISNSLKHLNKGGIICLHDTVPIAEWTTSKKPIYDDKYFWNGDVYRSIVKLDKVGINYFTIMNLDSGLTVLFDNYNKDIDLTQYNCDYKYKELFNDSNPNRNINRCTELGRNKLRIISIPFFLNVFCPIFNK